MKKYFKLIYNMIIDLTWISFRIETFIISGVSIEVAKLDNMSIGESRNSNHNSFNYKLHSWKKL